MLTNKLNLPESIVLAVMNDPYSRGESDISVTQLISPPYQRKLRGDVEQIEDVSERLFSLYGQIVHGILERSGVRAGLNVERRLFSEVNGWTVSGAYDLFEGGILMDYKFTTVWSVKGDEPKTEWEQQLNLLRALAVRNGMEVTGLRNVALLRDWSKKQAKRDPEYPQLPVAVVKIPVWDLAHAEAFMLERVKLHQHESPQPCTDEERWLKQPVFALKKGGAKRAVRLFDSLSQAEAALVEAGKDKHFIETRTGEYTRCESYCNVSHDCPAWKAHKENVPF
jgi:hypothetical protein